MEPSIALGGLETTKNVFHYRINSYTTDFGGENFSNFKVPELYFNVDFKRDFKTPFESDLLPVIIVMVLLFSALSLITRGENRDQLGFSSHNVLTYCISLFCSYTRPFLPQK